MKRLTLLFVASLVVAGLVAVPCFAQSGIWKNDVLENAVNFYVQSYDTTDNAVVVIYSPDAMQFAAFLDTDFESMTVDANDLGGEGHHLTMNFTDEDNATATLTLAGSGPVEYTLIRVFAGFGVGEKGDPGPEGPKGDTGDPGPAGPAGSSGVPGIYHVSETTSVAASSTAVCTASCNAGDEAIAGGFYAYRTLVFSGAALPEPGPGPVLPPLTTPAYPAVYLSAASDSSDGWRIGARNNDGTSLNLRCYAVCADLSE